MALGLGSARVGIGSALLAAPVAAPRLLGLDTATARRVNWLTRMTGARDVAIGFGTVVATVRGRGAWGWVLAGASADLADGLLLQAGLRDGQVSGVISRLAVGGSVGSSLAGVAAAAGLAPRLRRRG